MPIAVKCSSCNAKLQAPEAAVGRKIKCPKCQTPVLVAAQAAGTSSKASANPPGKPAATKPAATKATAARPAPPAPGKKTAAKATPTQAAAVTEARPRATKAKPPASADSPNAVEAGGSADWEESALLRHNEWTFREQGWVRLNIKNRHFHICEADTKDPIGYADEKASSLFLALRMMNKVGKWLPTTVEIRESQEGPLLLSIRKVNIPLLPWTDIEIYDGQKQKLGYFRTKIFSLLGGFWLYDADGKEVAEVKAKLGLPPRYLFLAKDGRELGSVANETMAKVAETKKMTVTVTTAFTRPSLRLKVVPEMANEPRIKVLMLATALAFEFTGVGDRMLNV